MNHKMFSKPNSNLNPLSLSQMPYCSPLMRLIENCKLKGRHWSKILTSTFPDCQRKMAKPKLTCHVNLFQISGLDINQKLTDIKLKSIAIQIK